MEWSGQGLTPALLWIHLAACLFMTGVIWIVQVVHYPSFAYVSPEQFREFAAFHSRMITFVVAPVMLLEMGTGVLLCVSGAAWTAWINLGILVVIWACTFFLSVPLHGILAGGYSAEVIEQLVFTNWPRTILWTVRSVLLLGVVVSALN